jgi:sulfoxide reductase heme-binding subunit YedZ
VTPWLWWTDRAAGLVLLTLLTGAVVTGLWSTGARPRRGAPRFATLALHRNLALLALCLLGLHVGTAVADSYVDIRWWQVVVPATSGFRPRWVGLGTITVDLLLAVAGTSLLRHRLGLRGWRAAHLLVWPAWLLGVWHALTLGSDVPGGAPWAVLPVGACLLAVGLAAAVRLGSLSRDQRTAAP